jgi:hypothetical protein
MCDIHNIECTLRAYDVRPDQTRPDQTRPDQTRPDQTRPEAVGGGGQNLITFLVSH